MGYVSFAKILEYSWENKCQHVQKWEPEIGDMNPSATVVSEEEDRWTWVDLGEGIELDR